MVISVNKISSAIPSSIPQVREGIVPAETVKKLTPCDKFNFRAYLHFKTLDFKTNPEEINALFKFEGDEFFEKTYEFLIKKLGIPEKLKPAIIERSASETVGMTYDWINNCIAKNPNGFIKEKVQIFGGLRHELQHFLQNMNVLRTEKVGDEVVNFYAKYAGKQRSAYADFEVKNLTLEQLKTNYDEQTLEYYKYLKDLLKNNPDAYESELINLRNIIEGAQLTHFQNFRNLVIQEMGLIKEGTQPARRAQKMLKEIMSENAYWQSDGSIHAGKYAFDVRENEAITAQSAAQLKTLPPEQRYCYLQIIKQQMQAFEELLKKEPNTKEINELLETSKEKAKEFNIDELISYLFD